MIINNYLKIYINGVLPIKYSDLRAIFDFNTKFFPDIAQNDFSYMVPAGKPEKRLLK